MNIQTPIDGLSNELAEVVRPFSLSEPISIVHEIGFDQDRRSHTVRVRCCRKEMSSTEAGSLGTEEYWEQKRLDRRAAKLACYRSLCKLTGKTQPWGSLTGVRPTALLRQLQRKDQEDFFHSYYGVTESKFKLSKQILAVQDDVMRSVPADAVCLYIHVPFCVTRCSYCSFPGRIAKKGEMEKYIDALSIEMDAAKHGLSGKRIAAIYIGGGTPTSLPLPLLETLLTKIEMFPGVAELTLEAGRPDTLDRDKLECAIAHGINRLCINPQTMSDDTLKRIGRAHTAKDIEDAFALARSAGFSHINMDIIAGLPGENLDDFNHTLERIRALSPTSFTCHTLSIKRGSRLQAEHPTLLDDDTASEMVDAARKTAREMGMEPYYLYRQKYMAGNLENVGYAKLGDACVYNIAMMDEMRSVIGIGVASVGKLIAGDLIVRKPNPRDLYVYLKRLPEICEQKRGFFCIDKQNGQAYNKQNSNEEERETI